MPVSAYRSTAPSLNRQAGLSQFLVDLSTPGVGISGIRDLAGSVHFNETLFEDVDLPADSLLGREGEGWSQCMSELAMERSGPERFLTTLGLLDATLETLRGRADDRAAAIVGRLTAHLAALRRMSRGVARQLQEGAEAASPVAGD